MTAVDSAPIPNVLTGMVAPNVLRVDVLPSHPTAAATRRARRGVPGSATSGRQLARRAVGIGTAVILFLWILASRG